MTETEKSHSNHNGSGPTDAVVSNSAQVSKIESIRRSWQRNWQQNNKKNLEKLSKEIDGYFASYTHPHKEFSGLLTSLLQSGRNNISFSCYVTKQFMNWISKPDNKDPEWSTKPDKDLQLQVMKLTSNSPSEFIKSLVFNIYELVDSSELLFTLAPQLQEKHQYIQLSQWVKLFNMEDKFDLNAYIYPMMLTRRCLDVIPLLEARKSRIMEVIKHADSLLSDQNAIKNSLLEYNMLIPKANSRFLKNVLLGLETLMKKCVKVFNISLDLTPNLYRRMIQAEIRFFVLKLSVNDMTEEGFKERLAPFCNEDPDRQKYLIQNLLKWKQTKYLAEYYCNLYDVNLDHPKGIHRGELEWDYHTVDNLTDMIVLVDSEPACKDMIKYIDGLSEEGNDVADSTSLGILVGVDMEWKSVSTLNTETLPALLQVAFDKKIFVIDITSVNSNLNFWNELNDKVLQNSKFLKLGYGLQDDQIKLASYSNLSFVSMNGNGFLDLLKEEKKYKESSKVKFPYGSDEAGDRARSCKGLSRLVALCFSKPLDKREQFSDWEKRPLRPSQLMYAALDAYCLLEVFGVLKEMHKESDLRFNISSTGSSGQPKKMKPKSDGTKRMQRTSYHYWKRNKRSPKKAIDVSIQAKPDCLENWTQTVPNQLITTN